MYNIEKSLSSLKPKKDAKKVEYTVDQPLLFLLHEHLIEMNEHLTEMNEFFCYLTII